jgi:hypothetical protein
LLLLPQRRVWARRAASLQPWPRRGACLFGVSTPSQRPLAGRVPDTQETSRRRSTRRPGANARPARPLPLRTRRAARALRPRVRLRLDPDRRGCRQQIPRRSQWLILTLHAAFNQELLLLLLLLPPLPLLRGVLLHPNPWPAPLPPPLRPAQGFCGCRYARVARPARPKLRARRRHSCRKARRPPFCGCRRVAG